MSCIKWRLICLSFKDNKYILLTEFEDHTVSNKEHFFSTSIIIYSLSTKHKDHELKQKYKGAVRWKLNWTGKHRTKWSSPYNLRKPTATSTNHSVFSTWEI